MTRPPDDAEERALEAAEGPQDSVQAMHGPHMDIMNEAGLVGTDPLPAEGRTDRTLGSDRPTTAVLMREKAEPRDGFEPAPFWAYLTYGLLLMWGGFYLGTASGPLTDAVRVFGVELPWFDSRTFDRNDLSTAAGGKGGAGGPPAADPDPQTVDELKKVGAQVYVNVCQACHQPSGLGNPGQNIPPLSGSEWVVGGEASPARLSRILLYGLNGPVTVAGRQYNGQMPAQGGALKDYQIAGVLTYIRNSWANAADPGPPAITAATLKAARAKEANRSTSGSASMTEAQLKALPLTHSDTAAAERKDATPPVKK